MKKTFGLYVDYIISRIYANFGNNAELILRRHNARYIDITIRVMVPESGLYYFDSSRIDCDSGAMTRAEATILRDAVEGKIARLKQTIAKRTVTIN